MKGARRSAENMKAELTQKDRRYLEKSLNAPEWKVILSVGTPLAMYQVLHTVFTVLDTMMAAHISKESVAAVAYLAQLNLLLSALGGGLAVGSGIMISRAYGQGAYTKVRRMVSSLYALCLLTGLCLLAGIVPFAGVFLRMAGTPEGLIDVGRGYFIVQMFAMVVTFLNNVYIAVERARGNARRIFWVNMAVIAVKLGLTAVFVYLMGGGLVMIAVATLLSQCVLLGMALRNSLGGENAFSFSLRAVTFRREILLPMLNFSIPVVVEKMLFAFGKTVVNSMCTVYGELMVGALGVSNNLGSLSTNPQNGFQEGGAAVMSQNFGAGRTRRVLRAFAAVLAVNVVLGGVISALELWQIHALASLFDSGSPEFHEMICQTYRYEALGAVPLGINAAVLSLLYGLGKTRLTLLLNVSRVFVFRIPVFWMLQNLTSLGSGSVGLMMMLSNTLVAVMAVVLAAREVLLLHRSYASGAGGN